MRKVTMLFTAALIATAIAAGPVAARQPGPTIVGTAIAVNQATGEFDELIAAVSRAGFVDTLNGNRQFTVFAPTDAAFEDLYATLGVSGGDEVPLDTLRAVLLHHVAPGERFSGDVLDAARIRTLNRDFVSPSLDGGDAFVDGAQIVLPDVDASNGVIHVIDAVLLPAG
ncbi:MAG TPA: fasciclin domain-containing protein [Candidatus Limnocylindrales bacterium]|nr:fasciclin domain-containing protein [Candidatus Limnocylindrales bacterium]